MNREFRCVACGLFFWEPYDYEKGFSWACPHCHEANNNEQFPVWSCDSTGFVYFIEANKGYFESLPKWTTREYTPAEYIEVYVRMGFEIRGDEPAMLQKGQLIRLTRDVHIYPAGALLEVQSVTPDRVIAMPPVVHVPLDAFEEYGGTEDDGEGVPLSPAADSAQSMLSDGDK